MSIHTQIRTVSNQTPRKFVGPVGEIEGAGYLVLCVADNGSILIHHDDDVMRVTARRDDGCIRLAFEAPESFQIVRETLANRAIDGAPVPTPTPRPAPVHRIDPPGDTARGPLAGRVKR